MGFLRRYLGIVLVLLLSLPSIIPFFHPGFFPMHDDTQVARVYEMGKALHDGMFPVRWVADLGYGYGYPIFNFYAPLPYYFGGFLTLIGIDALLATKIVFIVGILLSGIYMYIFARSFLGTLAGIVAATVYVYFPYHAVNIYVRGALGELYAYAFLPMVFLGLFKIVFLKVPPLSRWNLNSIKWVSLTSICIALTLLSHNLTAFMLLLFIALFLFIAVVSSRRKLGLLFVFVSALILGFSLSAFYSIPAILEARYTNVVSQIGGGADFKGHFVCFYQLWESMWGYGGSAPGCVDGMSFRLGKLNIVLFFGSLLLFILRLFKLNQVARYLPAGRQVFHRSAEAHGRSLPGGEGRNSSSKSRFIFLFSLFGFFLSVFLMLEPSRVIWDTIPFMAFIQYPWRFLNFAGLFISVIIGFCVRTVLDIRSVLVERVLFVSIIIALTLLFTIKLFQPQLYYVRDSSFYTSEYNIKWITSKISDEYMPPNFKKPKESNQIREYIVDIVRGKGEIEDIGVRVKTGMLSVVVHANEPLLVRINLAYFPAWKLFINGKESKFDIRDDGLYVQLPQGVSLLDSKFVQTQIEKASNVLSLIGIVVLVAGIMSHAYSKQYGRKAS